MRAGDRSGSVRFAAALLLLAACGGDPDEPASTGSHAADAAPATDADVSESDAALDAGAMDASASDAVAPDAAAPDAAPYEPPAVELPDPESDEPFFLSATGLYTDVEGKILAPDLRPFEPAHKLWSDGADKQRWMRLPRGTKIDSADMDHWQFPVGAMFWKEFGKEGKRFETRLVARTGEGPNDYWMGAFAWLEDESDARFVPMGEKNVRGSDHDVPTVKNCFTCHNGEPGRVLGFSAVQQRAVPAMLLTVPAPAYAVPGEAEVQRALGYLHANCAHCHNPNGSARPDTDMNLRLAIADERPEDTTIYRSTIGVDLQYFESDPLVKRVVAGNPEESGLLFRMAERGKKTQMPPLATEVTDPDGLAAVRAWIEGL